MLLFSCHNLLWNRFTIWICSAADQTSSVELMVVGFSKLRRLNVKITTSEHMNVVYVAWVLYFEWMNKCWRKETRPIFISGFLCFSQYEDWKLALRFFEIFFSLRFYWCEWKWPAVGAFLLPSTKHLAPHFQHFICKFIVLPPITMDVKKPASWLVLRPTFEGDLPKLK